LSTTITGRIGLIGDPVEHSLSPFFQQAAFDALGIDVRYELLHTPDDLVPQRLRELRSGDFVGVNVTVPHKETFYRAVDQCSHVAERVGAVNTIICSDGQLTGDNTDVHGFVQSLVDADFEFEGSRAIVLGAGGASRGVVVGLLDSGARQVILANRTIERAQAVVDDLQDERILPVTLAEVLEHGPEASLIVNATSLGWKHETLPVDRRIFTLLHPTAIAYDLTYQPTAFLASAREDGLHTIDGLAMLVHQGARSFEIWTGQPAPLEAMREAALAARNP
jgi:shikimate dehydrogenase